MEMRQLEVSLFLIGETPMSSVADILPKKVWNVEDRFVHKVRIGI